MADDNNKDHWGEVIFSLDEENETSAAPESVEETEKTDEPVKKRAVRKKAERKRPAVKKNERKKTEKKSAFSPEALDLVGSGEQARLDLTVGAEPARAGKTTGRRRSKKAVPTENDLIQEADRADRVKKADAIMEQAVLPFQTIASQITEIIQERSEEESAPKKASESKATGAKAPQNDGGFDDLFADLDDLTLDVSWGRPPKEELAAKKTASSEIAEKAPEKHEKSGKREKTENSEKSGRISKQAAEDLFAEEFAPSGGARKKSDAKKSASDEDFWGIPDEPEITFDSPRKKKSEPAALSASSAVPAASAASAASSASSAARTERRERGDDRRGGRREDNRRGENRRDENRQDDNRRGRRDNRREDNRREENRRDRRGEVEWTLPKEDVTAESADMFVPVSERPAVTEEPRSRAMSDEPVRERGGRGRRRGGRDDSARTQRRPAESEAEPFEPLEAPKSAEPVESSASEEASSANAAEKSYPSWQEAISQVIRFNMGRHGQHPKENNRRR